jgi:hypothetical protein
VKVKEEEEKNEIPLRLAPPQQEFSVENKRK